MKRSLPWQRLTLSANRVVLLSSTFLLFATTTRADHGAFNYAPLTEPILSATFSADFAALTAHRTVLGQELNMAQLLDLSTGLPTFDMSDGLFGTAVFPDPALIDMGPLQTGIVSAGIDSSFFPALESGHVGLRFLATDTDDGLFAIDFLSLTIETASGTITALHGPLGAAENNGFGLGLADGGNLPAAMPGVLTPTGTGFDEEISSKIIDIPEPGTLALLVLGLLGWPRYPGTRVESASPPLSGNHASPRQQD